MDVTITGAAADTIHLYQGHSNEDGTITVTSVISLCCSRVIMAGRGTVIPEQSTCTAASPDSGREADR